LVGGEGIIEFSVCRESGYEETFKFFGKGVVNIYSSVGSRFSLVFVMAFVDGLHERELPVCGLHVGFPYAIEKYKEQGVKISISCLQHPIRDTRGTRRLV